MDFAVESVEDIGGGPVLCNGLELVAVDCCGVAHRHTLAAHDIALHIAPHIHHGRRGDTAHIHRNMDHHRHIVAVVEDNRVGDEESGIVGVLCWVCSIHGLFCRDCNSTT